MDLLKTKIYLDKLNREYTRLSKDPDTIARIDVDIMASYVRELYDALLSDRVEPARQEYSPAPHRKQSPMRTSVPESPPEPAPYIPAPAPPPVVEETPPAAPPPVYEEKSQPAHHIKSKSPAGALPEADVLFEEKQAKELSEKLAEQPIADLKKAIALNDRLLLTRELFAGDGKAFESAIGALNGFSNFDEAKAYLLENCITRYTWLDKKRIEEAKKFIKVVRRRYK